MMFNADNRNNPVNVIWDCECDEHEIDQCGDEGFKTYDEARAWVQKYIIDDECQHNTYWKIVDDVTNKNIESNYDDVKKCEDAMKADGDDDANITNWFDEDEELVAEYEELLEEKRIEEVIRNIAISKICRNTIYNLGLGLKLSMKNCGMELVV